MAKEFRAHIFWQDEEIAKLSMVNLPQVGDQIIGDGFEGYVSGITWDITKQYQKHDVNISVSDTDPALDSGMNNGWIFLIDTNYTAESPLVLLDGIRTRVEHNLGFVLDDHAPDGLNAAAFWQDNRLNLQRLNDNYLVSVIATVDPTLNNRNLEIQWDTQETGSQPVIFDKTVRLARGAGVDTRIVEVADLFVGNTFLEKPAELYMTTDGVVNLFDLRLKISRIHKAS